MGDFCPILNKDYCASPVFKLNCPVSNFRNIRPAFLRYLLSHKQAAMAMLIGTVCDSLPSMHTRFLLPLDTFVMRWSRSVSTDSMLREEKVHVPSFNTQRLFRGFDEFSDSVVTENILNSWWGKSLMSATKYCVQSAEIYDHVQISSLSSKRYCFARSFAVKATKTFSSSFLRTRRNFK